MHPYRRVPALPPRLLLCLSCAQKQCDTLARWLQQVRLVFFTEHVVIGKIFVAKKYLVTPSVFKLQKWFLHQNGVEFNKKSKSDLTKLWRRVGG